MLLKFWHCRVCTQQAKTQQCHFDFYYNAKIMQNKKNNTTFPLFCSKNGSRHCRGWRENILETISKDLLLLPSLERWKAAVGRRKKTKKFANQWKGSFTDWHAKQNWSWVALYLFSRKNTLTYLSFESPLGPLGGVLSAKVLLLVWHEIVVQIN